MTHPPSLAGLGYGPAPLLTGKNYAVGDKLLAEQIHQQGDRGLYMPPACRWLQPRSLVAMVPRKHLGSALMDCALQGPRAKGRPGGSLLGSHMS